MVSLKEIIQEFQQVVKEAKLSKVSDAVIFECAVERFNVLNRFVSYKDLNAPATEKQLDVLKKNKMTIPAGLTKIEASKLIDELFARQNKKQEEKPEEENEEGSYY